MKKIARIYVSLLIHILRFLPSFFQLNWSKSVWITFNINNCTWKDERYNKIDVNVLFVPNWKGISRRILFSLYQNWRFFCVLHVFYETLLCLNHVSCSMLFSLLQFHLILYPFINSVMSFVFPFMAFIFVRFVYAIYGH